MMVDEIKIGSLYERGTSRRRVVSWGASREWVRWGDEQKRLPLGGFVTTRVTSTKSFAKWAEREIVSALNRPNGEPMKNIAYLCIAPDGGRHLVFAGDKEPTGWASVTPLIAADEGGDAVTNFRIEWIAAARPPVHPNPMTGKAWVDTFEDAVKHMESQSRDAKFVTLTEIKTTTVRIDRSTELRAALARQSATTEAR